MRAILTKLDKECKPVANVGNDPQQRRLIKSYKSMAMLYRYAIRPALKQWDGRVKAEIWNSDNIYKDPDRVMSFNTHTQE